MYRVRIFAAYADPGKTNYGQELFDFYWNPYHLSLALACQYISFPGDVCYHIIKTTFHYDGPDNATVELLAVLV